VPQVEITQSGGSVKIYVNGKPTLSCKDGAWSADESGWELRTGTLFDNSRNLPTMVFELFHGDDSQGWVFMWLEGGKGRVMPITGRARAGGLKARRPHHARWPRRGVALTSP
jgi:hypothetical protein